MIGPLLLLASWLLLRLEGRSLTALGIDQPFLRARGFALGLAIAALFAVAKSVVHGLWTGASWQVNPDASAPVLLEGLRFTTNSVLYEELLFRGSLLLLAIRYLGVRRGCWLSAGAFGVYHWFSYEVYRAAGFTPVPLRGEYRGSAGTSVCLARELTPRRQRCAARRPLGAHA